MTFFVTVPFTQLIVLFTSGTVVVVVVVVDVGRATLGEA